MFFAWEPIFLNLKIWKDLKNRLLSNKLAAHIFGVILSPHSKRETK